MMNNNGRVGLSRRQRITVAALGGGALAFAAVAGVNSVGASTAQDGPTASEPVSLVGGAGAMPRGGVVPPGTPCPEAGHLPPASLTSGEKRPEFSTPVILPDKAVAKVTDAWTCGRGPNVPVVMLGDVQVSYEPGWEGTDPAKFFAGMQSQRGGQVVEIAGLTAFLNDGDPTQGTMSLLAALTPDGVMVQLYGVRDPNANALVPIAKSILENRT